mmetsp:Transcript_17410/g.24187  ORF Transcript_17410/g.24187 Transcript_17410/m.24187 type:complete len:257 (+) Transcript_17410:155-925(+)
MRSLNAAAFIEPSKHNLTVSLPCLLLTLSMRHRTSFSADSFASNFLHCSQSQGTVRALTLKRDPSNSATNSNTFGESMTKLSRNSTRSAIPFATSSLESFPFSASMVIISTIASRSASLQSTRTSPFFCTRTKPASRVPLSSSTDKRSSSILFRSCINSFLMLLMRNSNLSLLISAGAAAGADAVSLRGGGTGLELGRFEDCCCCFDEAGRPLPVSCRVPPPAPRLGIWVNPSSSCSGVDLCCLCGLCPPPPLDWL